MPTPRSPTVSDLPANDCRQTSIECSLRSSGRFCRSGRFGALVYCRPTPGCRGYERRLENVVWKGARFSSRTGQFINHGLASDAVQSRVELGHSWYDGQPCLVMEYPPEAAAFANNRDELREIAPE